jgi:hypothetical protein
MVNLAKEFRGYLKFMQAKFCVTIALLLNFFELPIMNQPYFRKHLIFLIKKSPLNKARSKWILFTKIT